MTETKELKKQIQVAHNVLLTELGNKCGIVTEKCAICLEVENTMLASQQANTSDLDGIAEESMGGADD